jgi:hypothetical protein
MSPNGDIFLRLATNFSKNFIFKNPPNFTSIFIPKKYAYFKKPQKNIQKISNWHKNCYLK